MKINNFSKYPLYEIEIKSIYCSLELWVNDILIFCHFEENGSIWVDWPINQYILESGTQNFELKLFPYKNQVFLFQNMEVEMGIHFRDEKEGIRFDIIERNLIHIPNKEQLPFFSYKGVFDVKIPYELKGWKKSLDLNNENKNDLLKELMLWNNKLLEIYRKSDIVEYNKIFKERTEEFDKSYYLTEQSDDNVFHSKFKDLISLPDNNYELNFYAHGKLVSVKLTYKLPGFTYEPKIKDEDSLGISLIVFFH